MRYRSSRRWRGWVTRHLRRLFHLAEVAASENPELARRYIRIARRIVLRTRVRIPSDLRHRFCHHCDHFLRPGVNARIRLRNSGRETSIVITCLDCGNRRKIRWPRRGKIVKDKVSKSRD